MIRVAMLGAAALCVGAAVSSLTVSADDAKPVAKPTAMPTARPAAKPTANPMTGEQRVAKGKDLVDSICFWCHEPELMLPKRLDKDEWSELIRPMVYEGAPVTDDEFAMIVEYLAKTFGPEKKDQ